MKNTALLTALFFSALGWTQEHFTGINTSNNAGLMNVTLNPAASGDTENGVYINFFSVSGSMTNNKIGFSDLISGKNFETSLFSGSESANLRLDGQMLGPSVAWKLNKWAFFFTTSANSQANIVNIDNRLGNAVVNNTIDLGGSASILTQNQRASGVAWGEIGIGLARQIFSANGHTLYAGANFKWMAAGSFINMSATQFSGTLAIQGNNVSLTNANAKLNFAYSGKLGDDFTRIPNFMDYFGKIGGMSTDLGLNYSWKQENDEGYVVVFGAALKNLGAMKFNAQNSSNSSYTLNIPNGQYFNLSQFKDEGDIKVIEQRLLQSGYLQVNTNKQDIKVKAPSLFVVNANVKLYNRFYLGAVLQEKLHSEMNDDQLNAQDIITFIPRYANKNIEVFLPVSHYQISGTVAGVGMRYRAFFIGSGSILTGLVNNSGTHQVDGYIGFRIAL